MKGSKVFLNQIQFALEDVVPYEKKDNLCQIRVILVIKVYITEFFQIFY